MKIYIYDPGHVHGNISKKDGLRVHDEYYNRFIRVFCQRYRTYDPHSADYFFVPVNLIRCQFNKKNSDPKAFVEDLEYLGKKRHLLLATGDFGQRKKSRWESMAPGRAYPHIFDWLDDRFILLCFESTVDLMRQDIAIFPYLHSRSFLKDRVNTAFCGLLRERNILYSFVGAMSYPQLPQTHIRGGRMYEIAGEGSDFFVGGIGDAKKKFGVTIRDRRVIQKSVFTLCPAGYGRWTFRVFEALSYGSIPVIISDGYVKPFPELIKWDEITLTIPEADLKDVPALLRSFPRRRIKAMQESIKACAHLFSEQGLYAMLEWRLERDLAPSKVENNLFTQPNSWDVASPVA